MRRRELLGVLGAGCWGLAVPDWRLKTEDTRWRTQLNRIGIQLYTVRRDLSRDVEGTLARLAEIGFREVEFAGYPQGTGASLRAILDRHRLTAPSSHVSLQATRTDWERTLDEAATVGQRYIVVAWLDAGERKTIDDWKRIAALFNRAAETAQSWKIRFAYHNHDFEFAAIDGKLGYDVLLAETDPKLVGFEMDLYWITKGGKDPLEYFAKYPGRFPMLHIKDMDATARKGFAEVGKGIIDFRRILKRARQAGVKHYFYEQDVTPGSPFESAQVSYDYLKGLRF